MTQGNDHAPKILVVDDDPLCRDMLQAVLTDMGFVVDTAEDGQTAYEMVCFGDFRIVISDWQMPGMSGIELCEKLRSRRLGEYVYIILLSALGGTENLVRGLQAGADDFLSKPFDPVELHVRLNTARRIVSLENRDLIVFSMAKLAESRDSDTGAHLERMREYSRLLAQELSRTPKYENEIDSDFIRAIFLTSPLHDIGKVGIPDHILLKPGKLTPEEFEIMKQHVTIGCQTLDAAYTACPSAEYLRLARDIAATHHEKFDGTGYPHGLRGTEIPLCGRIVALADVYDALTTKRVYKDAMPHQQARKIIVESRGTHFDPDIVDAFLRQEDAFQEVRRKLDDDHAFGSSLPPVVTPANNPQLLFPSNTLV
ncbi:MAG: response regulator [Planctomycetota bacterium]|nr:MAG: response regulator [Planctomycetota bacterium]